MADHLSFATPPVTPPTSLRSRLLDRVRNETHLPERTLPPLTFVRASEGTWQEMAPGVTAKILHFDPVSRRATALVRMAPGSVYAPHRHAEPEEFYVLEGDVSAAVRSWPSETIIVPKPAPNIMTHHRMTAACYSSSPRHKTRCWADSCSIRNFHLSKSVGYIRLADGSSKQRAAPML